LGSVFSAQIRLIWRAARLDRGGSSLAARLDSRGPAASDTLPALPRPTQRRRPGGHRPAMASAWP